MFVCVSGACISDVYECVGDDVCVCFCVAYVFAKHNVCCISNMLYKYLKHALQVTHFFFLSQSPSLLSLVEETC